MSRPPSKPCQLCPVAVFSTVDEMLHQVRAGEDGRAEFNSLRLRDRVVVAPNAEDLAGELVAFGGGPQPQSSGSILRAVADHPLARSAAQHPSDGRGRRRQADVAGLLVFATEPTDFLESGSIEAARYRDTRLSSDDLIHAERLGGPVSDQIDAGIAFVARFMRSDDSSAGSPHYDLDVVDEAIVNAVAHRDYDLDGSKICLLPLRKTDWSSTARGSCPTPSCSTTCPTAPSPPTSSS